MLQYSAPQTDTVQCVTMKVTMSQNTQKVLTDHDKQVTNHDKHSLLLLAISTSGGHHG